MHANIIAYPEALGPDRGQPDRAGAYHPYPCVSSHRFITDMTSKYPIYQPLARRVPRVRPRPPLHKALTPGSLVEAVPDIANPSPSMVVGLLAT